LLLMPVNTAAAWLRPCAAPATQLELLLKPPPGPATTLLLLMMMPGPLAGTDNDALSRPFDGNPALTRPSAPDVDSNCNALATLLLSAAALLLSVPAVDGSDAKSP
jgi:hypothetical protein